jgi:hypothetical protein
MDFLHGLVSTVYGTAELAFAWQLVGMELLLGKT